MPWLLDYAAQVAELEKMARLSPPREVRRARPRLGAPDPAAACLVCGATPARPCSACDGVVYCGEAHQQLDARWHDGVCDALRTIAEDAALADRVPRERLVAELCRRAREAGAGLPTGWDALLGEVPDGARRRLLTDLATRPLTLAHVLHALAIRGARPGVLAIHVMAAAEREAAVAPALWGTLARWFPGTRFELALVGPELPATRPAAEEHPQVTLRLRTGPYRRALWEELGRPDLIVGFDCGLLIYPAWKPTIVGLCGAGAPFVITSYRGWEAAAEARVLAAVGARPALAPVDNPFASRAAKRSTLIANDVSHDNAIVSAWR